MSATTEATEKQVKQAEELLFSGPQAVGFGKGLFFGQYVSDWISPFPTISAARKEKVEPRLEIIRDFVANEIDPERIDRDETIHPETVEGLGRIGALGATAPEELGGHGFSQLEYCKALEMIGGRCSATSIFVNAHHSIGMRALLLFGTQEQKDKWLPGLVSGAKLGAFALTEPEAGSDAANVQTHAKLSEDGQHYVLNGEKRYITNGAIAQVLTVMAKTDIPGRDEPQVTAFLVEPDMEGFHVLDPNTRKLGVRGTAQAKLKFENMKVPVGNVLGPLGKGLRVALTVLDFGRTTFGACCTGAAKTCRTLAIAHARKRVQFGRKLGEFDLVKKKIAQMDAWIYAMESMTDVTAGMIDRGLEDYMLETAMLKVWTTEVLWTMVNDTFQIYGGEAYFNDSPMGRILRDARINQIGEGANDVLRSFISLVGMRGPGEPIRQAMEKQGTLGAGSKFVSAWISSKVNKAPDVPVRTSALQPYAKELSRIVKQFGVTVLNTMAKHQQALLENQYVQERISEIAMELYASGSVLSRLDSEIAENRVDARERRAAELFLKMSNRRMKFFFEELNENDDTMMREVADAALQLT